MGSLVDKLAKASRIPSFDHAYDLPDGEDEGVFDDGPQILVWVALARAFQHKWLPLYDDMAEPEGILEDLDMLVDHLGVAPEDVGASASWLSFTRSASTEEGREVWSHVSKTRRIRWMVDGAGNATIEIFRKAEDTAGRPVIRITTERDTDENETEITFDPRLTLGADYGRRHVAVLHTALFALTTVPPDLGGITKKKAMMIVKMIAAGAS